MVLSAQASLLGIKDPSVQAQDTYEGESVSLLEVYSPVLQHLPTKCGALGSTHRIPK